MALWGGRFSSETRNEVTQYSESISFDQRLYHFDIAGSKAHVTMLAEQGIIPAETAKAIREERIERRIDAGEFRYDIAMEDIHMHIESALIEALGAEGARVHSARSRNDQVALDIRLYLRSEVDSLIAELRHFQRALVAQADAHPRTVMPGFTHLQHAQPVLFAHHLLAYVEMLDRDAERLAGCRERINVMPLGSGAIAGSNNDINSRTSCDRRGLELGGHSAGAQPGDTVACNTAQFIADIMHFRNQGGVRVAARIGSIQPFNIGQQQELIRPLRTVSLEQCAAV